MVCLDSSVALIPCQPLTLVCAPATQCLTPTSSRRRGRKESQAVTSGIDVFAAKGSDFHVVTHLAAIEIDECRRLDGRAKLHVRRDGERLVHSLTARPRPLTHGPAACNTAPPP